VPTAEPGLDAFLAGPDTRLRDLLAFGMAVEAGKPLAPGDISALRQKAEAELATHAVRTLHNRVEEIRLDAAAEALSRAARASGGLGTVILGNLIALAVAGGAAWVGWRMMTVPLGGG
jgi:hypothetical protein